MDAIDHEGTTDAATVAANDAARMRLVLDEHDDGLLITASDFEIAARIYRRGTTALDVEHARFFEQWAWELRQAAPR